MVIRQKKKTACISMDAELYHKLNVICTIKRHFYDDQKATMSSVVDAALNEYFRNHQDEIDAMMKDYHEKGGCFEL